MKAFFFLPTLMILLCSWSLPKLNTTTSKGGKIIKAPSLGTEFLNCTVLFGHDTTEIPEFSILRRKGSYEVNTVVIDPGHGGHDPGCHGTNSKEKHVCLAVGKYLEEAIRLNFPGVKVILTRSTDVFIPLNERAAIATRNKADLFISIHCNAISNASKTMGTETYVLGLHATEANLAVAKRENEAILYEENYQETYDGYDPNSTEAHIMFSMFQNAFLEQSLSFADKVQKHSNNEAKRKNRGVKQAGFLVLRHATMPSVLVETGFLTNATDESFLRTQNGQKTMANALLLAFAEYKLETEGGNQVAVKKLDLDVSSDEDVPTVALVEQVLDGANKQEVVAKPVKIEQEPIVTNTKPDKRKIQPVQQAAPTYFPEERTKTETNQASEIQNITPSRSSAQKILVEKPIAEAKEMESNLPSQNTDIQYRVQLAASPKQMDVSQGKWSKVDYLIQVVEENKLFKYQVVNFATQDEALEAKSKLRALGFNDAFVVIYQNGKRIN